MSSYSDYFKDPMMVAAMKAMAKANRAKWEKCSKCGEKATGIDCEGAFLFPVCSGCIRE